MRQKPLEPPLELVQRWGNSSQAWFEESNDHWDYEQHIANLAAKWGADQELTACCDFALTAKVCGTQFQRQMLVRQLKERRRPVEESIKEKAFDALYTIAVGDKEARWNFKEIETIRQALELLPNDSRRV